MVDSGRAAVKRGETLSRTCVIGDVHSNLPALEAVIAAAGECDSWLCIGDLVGYGPDPNECVARVTELGALCVAGNHDLGSTGSIDLASFNRDARAACEWTGRVLDRPARSFLESLESRREGDGWLMVHASPRDPVWEYVLSKAQAYHNFLEFDQGLCFHGHSHAPAVFRWSAEAQDADDFAAVEVAVPADGDEIPLEAGFRFLVNVGSVGQPRDYDPRACHVIHDRDRAVLEYHRVTYPVAEVQARMEGLGLPSFLVERLSFGR
jgi:diadenosine tetraphosphatase ApaH/serine/threonine PP2A family protein phosphatase